MRQPTANFFCLALLALSPLFTADANAQLANDTDNFYGDSLRPSVNIQAKLKIEQTDVCIPGGTRLMVIGQSALSLFVKVKLGDNRKECDGVNELSERVAYEVTKSDVRESGTTRTGITYGALVVPFKYQTSGAKDFVGSAAVGGYAGYRFEDLRKLGITATPIAFMGASNISVPAGSTSTSENVMGFSYGVGLIGTFKGSFQTGIVIGWDRVGKNIGYQYNGKPWIALEIGYAFLQ
jgi:hypothetical protein